MVLFSGLISIKTITFLIFSVFGIAALGYLLGRVTVKGVSLGTAGVFIVALLYGAVLYTVLQSQLTVSGNTETTSFVKEALKVVENLGLVLFVTSVGFIAGPSFFKNLRKNFKSYVLLGLIIIGASVAVTVAVIFLGQSHSDLNHEEFKAMVVGILSGALTSTPAFSAAKEAVGSDLEDLVSVGHGIAYLFGVIGVVLFVQLMPKIQRANMAEERAKIYHDPGEKKNKERKLIELDEFGLCVFAVAAILGIFVGSLGYKGFSLTVTGGCLLASLVLGHFNHIGKIDLLPRESTLKVFRELGLMLFLIGAGVSGGASFVRHFRPIYFVYGVIMTVVPMVLGFFFAKYVLKLPLLNNLGSITGGMTSTPALGTLISTAGTEDVASAYAATYPVALITIVLASKLIVSLC